MFRRASVLSTLAAVVVGSSTFGVVGRCSAEDLNPKDLEFFEKKIRPVLVKHCYECHSADSEEAKGGLLLDTREGIRQGGDSGHAVVPGDLQESLLIGALKFEDFEMPPEEPLPDTVIADFERWIRRGAPDPREGKSAKRIIDIEAGRNFWAFQPIRSPAVPEPTDNNWSRTDIDRFILARQESAGLRPVSDAQPADLIRRVYFDLIGLPPTPEQSAEYVQDPTPARLNNIVDRLLESPHFGERWGRHWLDVVRYGESTGMERNFTFPYAWRYRDYVIDSFQQDQPFDQFIVEQVAGDLLPAESLDERRRLITATGLLAMGTKSLNETNREQFKMDLVDDQIDVTTQAFLGITAACARCHDHKFDPIPTREYYALAGIFGSTQTYYGTGGQRGNRQPGQLLSVTEEGVKPQATKNQGGNNQQARRLRTQLTAAKKQLQQLRKRAARDDSLKPRVEATANRVAKLERQLKQAGSAQRPNNDNNKPSKPFVIMGVQDAQQIADTQLRVRGEPNDRGDTIERGFLSIATCSPEQAAAVGDDSSGRLEYARWMIAADNPLTARVAANRIWQHLFGKGIVVTVNNFGQNGDRPTHPELLDYLATRFMQEGWSTKQLIREMVNSRVYQLSCDSHAGGMEVDPDNRFLWHMNQRRLEAEVIRDAMLAVSGQLDLTPPKGSPVEAIGDTNIGQTNRGGQFAMANNQRSVYLPIVRGMLPEILQVFDFPDPSIIFGQREVTTVPTQALFMMNNPFVLQQSQAFARRLLATTDMTAPQRVEMAYQLALGRTPSDAEVNEALQYIRQAAGFHAKQEGERVVRSRNKAWAEFCQALIGSSEFRYVN